MKHAPRCDSLAEGSSKYINYAYTSLMKDLTAGKFYLPRAEFPYKTRHQRARFVRTIKKSCLFRLRLISFFF